MQNDQSILSMPAKIAKISGKSQKFNVRKCFECKYKRCIKRQLPLNMLHMLIGGIEAYLV